MVPTLEQSSLLPRAVLSGCVASAKSLCPTESLFPHPLGREGDRRGVWGGSHGFLIVVPALFSCLWMRAHPHPESLSTAHRVSVVLAGCMDPFLGWKVW